MLPEVYPMRSVLLIPLLLLLVCGCKPKETHREVSPESAAQNAGPELTPISTMRTRNSVREQKLASRETPWPEGPQIHRSEGYVGAASCQECHAEEHHSWTASYHSTMTQIVSPATVIPEVNDEELSYLGNQATLEWRGDELWTTVTDATGETTTRQIVLSTGSHHAQAFWYTTGDTRVLRKFPFSYRVAEQRWVPGQSVFLLPPDAEKSYIAQAGVWNHSCSQCHATAIQPRVSSIRHMETQVADFGIACESCHGPGEAHIEATREAEANDLKIVNPYSLGGKRSSQVCGQCHAALTLADESAKADWLQHGWRYRPGDDLHQSKTVRQPTPDEFDSIDVNTFWSDGVVRVSGREFNGLLKSPCYTHDESQGETLSCMHCHQLHGDTTSPESLAAWSDNQVKPGMRSNRACIQCHEQYEDEPQLAAHTHHETTSGGSKCMNCHMPHTSYGLLKAARSHTIENPSVATTLDHGRPNGCNQCHLDRSLGWTAGHLNDWYGIESPEIPEDHRTVSYTVLASLEGNAIERALAAWTIGWPETDKASTKDWTVPYLGFLLQDNYHAVRLIADRSLRTLPGFADVEYDSLDAKEQRDQAARTIVQQWLKQDNQLRTKSPSVLISPNGTPIIQRIDAYLKNRDTTKIFIAE